MKTEIKPIDRIESQKILREFLDPLSKKDTKGNLRNKDHEYISIIEKEMFEEAEKILKNKKLIEAEKLKKQEEILEKERIPLNYIPINITIKKLQERYYDKSIPTCSELDNKEVNLIFSKYDKSNMEMIQKSHIQFIFYDIKHFLSKNYYINEKKFVDNFLDFYTKSKETCTIEEIKKCFSVILHEHRSNIVINSFISCR